MTSAERGPILAGLVHGQQFASVQVRSVVWIDGPGGPHTNLIGACVASITISALSIRRACFRLPQPPAHPSDERGLPVPGPRQCAAIPIRTREALQPRLA
jgi:hypothetical protein